MKCRINSLVKCIGFVFAAAATSICPTAHAADTGEITIRVDQPGATFNRLFYGLMTEEINHCYDGGLYAELIRNRIFRNSPPRWRVNPGQTWWGNIDPAKPPHWSLVESGGADGAIMLDTENPVNTTALTTSLRLDMKGGGGRIGVANEGFWGIPVKPNTQYKASFYARASDDFKGPLKLTIQSNDGATEFATATIPSIGKSWKRYNTTLKTGAVTESKNNRFVISADGDSKGSVWFNLVSLFPPTYRNRPNGLRIDIMEKLAALKPNYLRFPGGNYIEGPDFENRFNWKNTIGPLEERPGHEGPWGYRSSDGLGLLEFLLWCEDLKMEPVLGVYAGLHIDGGKNIITGDALKPHVQDALDEIEYITGDTSTTWGARRAKDGHPEPFKLTYVEIGNEDNLNNGTPSYSGRFEMFYDAIKAKYPHLQIISTIPPNPRSPTLHNLSRKPDVIDDHLYNPAEGLMRNSTRHNAAVYRNADAPKIFMGEWASNGQDQGRPTPNLRSALGDAAFLGGLERNADVVIMQCYAPLFVNVNRGNPPAAQWDTNLIGYDALNSFGSTSFYAQKMYSENRGDRVLPVVLTAPPREVAEVTLPKGRVGVGTWATRAEFKDIKVTAGDKVLYELDPKKAEQEWTMNRAGSWTWDGGTLRQTSIDQNCRATVGDPAWTDYTYTLKARKLSGAEGFLILFHVQDNDNWLWWNIGGWNNTRSAIERTERRIGGELGRQQDVTIQPNRWYDIKVEVEGRRIRCYLDGELVAERADAPPPPPAPMYANAVLDSSSGDVILRVVNTEAAPRTLSLNLQGVKNVAGRATVEELSGQPTDMNSLDTPTKIAPKKRSITNAAPSFSHEFPAYSVSVIRLKPQ